MISALNLHSGFFFRQNLELHGVALDVDDYGFTLAADTLTLKTDTDFVAAVGLV
jgi:hypothetical protein